MTKEIAPAGQLTPAHLLEIAVKKDADLDKLDKLMELQIRWEDREARKAYVAAMAAFKEDPPKIIKDAGTDFQAKSGNSRVKYNYATLANVVETISKALSEHGLSAHWTPKQGEDWVSVTCTITHVLGHSESATMSGPHDNTGGKNAIQAIGSSVSYLERYTLLALTGLSTHEQDNDANVPECISADMAKMIDSEIKKTGADKAKFLEYLKADSITTIRLVDYPVAVKALELKAKGVK